MTRLSAIPLGPVPQPDVEVPDVTEAAIAASELAVSRSGPAPQYNFNRVLGSPLHTLPDNRISKFQASMEEGNFVAMGARALGDFFAREFKKPDPHFDPAAAVTAAFGEGQLTLEEQSFLIESRSSGEMMERWRQVAHERERQEVLSEMGFGESLGFGLIAGATDPTSYIPLFGQAGRVKNVSNLYRQTSQLLARGGIGVKAARLNLIQQTSGGFRRGFWHGAAEAAVYETAFQQVLRATTINKDYVDEGMIPSIAMTSAFSGLFTGGAGALSHRSARRQIGNRARLRTDPSLRPVMSAAAGGLEQLEPGRMGKGSGARVRLQYAAIVRESKVKAKADLMALLQNTGIAGDEVEASSLAQRILDKRPEWIAPIKPDGTIRSTSFELRAASLLGKEGGELRPKNLAASKGALTKRINRMAPDPDHDPEMLAELKRQRKELDDYGRVLTQEEETAEAAKDAAARNLNNPRPASETATPEGLAKDGVGDSPAAKVSEVDGEAKGRSFLQRLSDGYNGTHGITDLFRYAFGRGMFSLMDGKTVRIGFPKALNAESAEYSVKIKVITDLDDEAGDWYGNFVPGNGKAPDRILINYDRIVADYAEGRDFRVAVLPEGSDLRGDLNKVDPKKVRWVNMRDKLQTPEEYADFVVMHELAHQVNKKFQKGQELTMEKAGKGAYNYEPKPGQWSDTKKIVEAHTNSLVMHWKRAADELEAEGGPHVSEGYANGPEPRGSSVVVNKGDDPTHSLVGSYVAQGWEKAKATKIAQWLRTTSPLARAATSPSLVFRTVVRHLTESPLYLNGSPVEGGAASMKVSYKYEQPVYKIRAKQEELWDKISDEATEKLGWDAYDARVHRAIATGSDNVSDEFTSAVNEIAGEYIKFNRMLEAEGQGIGWVGRQVFPQGENYYRRIYNYQKVDTPDFIKMLVGRGLDEEEAIAIQDSIKSNYGVPADEFSTETGLRGALRKRNSVLAEIPYDDLAPFLDTSAFRTQLNAAKAMGGEIELRTGVVNAVKELNASGRSRINVDDVLQRKSIVTGETGEAEDVIIFNLDPLREAIAEEFRGMKSKGGLILDDENMSLAFERDWGKGSELAEKYPEHAAHFREFADNPVNAAFATKEQLGKEDVFAGKFLDQVVATLQHKRDLVENPDSWLQARLPAFIKNASHAIMGGFVGVANIADFHRSVAEYGFKRAFKHEWGLLIRDLEGFSKRAKATEEMGLALEHVYAGIDRSLRNMSEHIVPQTKAEKLAQSGAALMSRLNGMDRITNGHQKMFSSSTQGFILDNIDDLLDGNLSKNDVLRMERLNIDKAQARKIKEWLDSGALKKTKGGTKYVDMSTEGPGRQAYLASVQKGVYALQTVPSRDELFDAQVQKWGGVLMMYRNWVSAANNRVAGTALSNADSAMMAGLAASVGLGAIITTVRWMIGGTDSPAPWEDPDQFLRDSMLSGGYLGLAGEAGQLVARATNGKIDPLILGEGNRARFHNHDTVMSAMIGPVWHYPSFVTNTLDDTSLDRHDWNRIWGMVPFNNLFYVDGLWNAMGINDGD